MSADEDQVYLYTLGFVVSFVVLDVELTWSNTINVLDPLIE